MGKFELRGLRKLRGDLDAMARQSRKAAVEACFAGTGHLLDVMQSQFLSGQVIGRVEEDLHNKWTTRRVSSPPGAILGTGVPYAYVQEYGSHAEVQIPEHHRRRPFSAEGLTQKTYKSAPTYRRKKFTKARTAFQESSEGAFMVKVKAHRRHLNLEPRKFLRGAIERARPTLPKVMGAVFREVLRGG